MSHRLLSVCIFCFVCATHSPCASHAAIGHIEQHRRDGYKDPNIPVIEANHELSFRDKRYTSNSQDSPVKTNEIAPRNRLVTGENDDPSSNLFNSETEILERIFAEFGEGDKMSAQSLRKLIKKLDLLHVLSEKLFEHDLDNVDVRKEAREAERNNVTVSCFIH